MSQPIQVIRVAIAAEHVRRVKITCRCGRAWVETIPEELHDAKWMAAEFECQSCARVFRLQDKQLRCLNNEEVKGGRQEQTTHHVYDA